MTDPNPLREDEMETRLSVCWYPGDNRLEGSWHVVADGWRHVSSHRNEDDARDAIMRLDQVREGRGK